MSNTKLLRKTALWIALQHRLFIPENETLDPFAMRDQIHLLVQTGAGSLDELIDQLVRDPESLLDRCRTQVSSKVRDEIAQEIQDLLPSAEPEVRGLIRLLMAFPNDPSAGLPESELVAQACPETARMIELGIITRWEAWLKGGEEAIQRLKAYVPEDRALCFQAFPGLLVGDRAIEKWGDNLTLVAVTNTSGKLFGMGWTSPPPDPLQGVSPARLGAQLNSARPEWIYYSPESIEIYAALITEVWQSMDLGESARRHFGRTTDHVGGRLDGCRQTVYQVMKAAVLAHEQAHHVQWDRTRELQTRVGSIQWAARSVLAELQAERFAYGKLLTTGDGSWDIARSILGVEAALNQNRARRGSSDVGTWNQTGMYRPLITEALLGKTPLESLDELISAMETQARTVQTHEEFAAWANSRLNKALDSIGRMLEQGNVST